MYFITDRWENEPCVLAGNENKILYIKSLEGKLLAEIKPKRAWTHEILMDLDLTQIKDIEFGANAYLGEEWVGSTEC